MSLPTSPLLPHSAAPLPSGTTPTGALPDHGPAEPTLATAVALDLQGIAHRFQRSWVLRGVSLMLLPGEVVALLGGNGAGKTTLLRIAATLLRPLRGAGSVFGRDLVAEAGEVRELVGLLGHTAALYEDLTAEENLRFAMRMRGRRADAGQLARLLEEVGLWAKENQPVRSFSSGMRRRLALARVLLAPPRLLLLDEPYASLDREGVVLVNRLIRSTAAGGGAVLLATHDLLPARPLLTRSVLLQAGVVREVDPEEAARQPPADEDAALPLWTADEG